MLTNNNIILYTFQCIVFIFILFFWIFILLGLLHFRSTGQLTGQICKVARLGLNP